MQITPTTRKIGRLSDGSDHQEIPCWQVAYTDDEGERREVQFDHEPTPADLDALRPRHVEARRRWGQATTTPAMLRALAYKLGLAD